MSKRIKFEVGDVVRVREYEGHCGFGPGEHTLVATDFTGFVGGGTSGDQYLRGWLPERFELVRKNPDTLIRTRLVVTAKDRQGNMGSTIDCPIARSVKRRVKSGVNVSVGGTRFSVWDATDTQWYSHPLKYWERVREATGTIHFYVNIPQKYLR